MKSIQIASFACRRHGGSGSSLLARYAVGDTVVSEIFGRVGSGTFFDVNGVLQTAATGVKRDAHYIGGNKTFLLEVARTNVVTFNRDFTNAAWVKTGITPAKDQLGIDGVAASASSLLATTPNATVLQAIVLASSARAQFCYIKRLVGAGVVNMTMDNGVTWTPVAVTGAYTKVTIPSQTLANPTVGFQIVTSGDSIAVDYFQNENGAVDSSPILTAGAAVLRNADKYGIPVLPSTIPVTIYCRFTDLTNGLIASSAPFAISNPVAANPSLITFYQTRYRGQHHNGTTSVATGSTLGAAALGDTIELRLVFFADGSVTLGQSVNGAAEVVTAQTAALAPAAAWSSLTYLWLGTVGGVSNWIIAGFRDAKMLKGNRTLTEMRAA